VFAVFAVFARAAFGAALADITLFGFASNTAFALGTFRDGNGCLAIKRNWDGNVS